MMKWLDVKENYPSKWLLVEAIEATRKNHKRIIEKISVVEAFETNDEALQMYLSMHRRYPYKELYVVHSSTESLEIEEFEWFKSDNSPKSINLTKKRL